MLIVDPSSRFLEKNEDAALLFSGDFWMFLRFVLFQISFDLPYFLYTEPADYLPPP